MVKCHRTGKTVYPMDNPIKIDAAGRTLIFSRSGFTCASSLKTVLTSLPVLLRPD